MRLRVACRRILRRRGAMAPGCKEDNGPSSSVDINVLKAMQYAVLVLVPSGIRNTIRFTHGDVLGK